MKQIGMKELAYTINWNNLASCPALILFFFLLILSTLNAEFFGMRHTRALRVKFSTLESST